MRGRDVQERTLMSSGSRPDNDAESVASAKARMRAAAQIVRRQAFETWTRRSTDAAGAMLAAHAGHVLAAARDDQEPRIAWAHRPRRTALAPLPLVGAFAGAGL